MSPHFCGSIFLGAFVPTSPASKRLQAAGLAEKMQEPDFLRVLGCAGQSGHMYCQQEEGVGVAGDTAEAMGPEAPCASWSARTVPRLARLAPPTPLVVGRGGVPAGGEPADGGPQLLKGPRSQRRRGLCRWARTRGLGWALAAATGQDVPVLPTAVAQL